MARYIKLDEKKIKELKRQAQQFQDDIVCAIGTDFMQKIAGAENKTIFDIVKGLENAPTEDVVPRSEVEELQREYDSLAKTVISSTELIRKLKGKAEKANQEVEKADKEIERLTKILENYALQYGTVTDKQKVIEQAKQEVAREIFEEIEKLLARHSHTCLGYSEIIGNYYYEKQLGNSIDELKKKYIGKDTNVLSNIGE